MENKTEPIRDNSKRANIAVIIFWIICGLNLLAVISDYFEYNLLSRINDGEDVSYDEANANDIRQMIIGFSQSALYITSMVVFLNWFRRAYANLHRLNITGLRHKDNMAVWSFIIPIVSLYWPLRIMREIWNETQKKIKELIPDHLIIYSSLIGWWWAAYIITNVVSRISFKAALKSDTVIDMMTSSQVYMLSDSLDIIAAIITLLVIKQVAKEETILYAAVNNIQPNQVQEKTFSV